MVSASNIERTEPATRSPQSSQPPAWLTSLIVAKQVARNAVRGDVTTIFRLLGELRHSDSSKRLAAAKNLALCSNFGDYLVISTLLNIRPGEANVQGVDDAVSDIRISSIETVAKLVDGCANSQVIQKLLTKLEDEDWAVRKAAVVALGSLSKTDDNMVLRTLLCMLREGEWWGKVAASDALGRIASRGNKPVVEQLVNILKDQDWSVRKYGCIALARVSMFGDKYVVEALLELLGDADWRVRKAAVEALGDIADEGCEAAVEGLLSRLEDKQVGQRKLLDTPSLEDPDVKGSAVKCLIRVARPGDEALILALRRLGQREPASRRFAQEAITGLSVGLNAISLAS